MGIPKSMDCSYQLALTRAMAEHEQFNSQTAHVLCRADMLLRSAPQAAPPRATPARTSRKATAEVCARLCDEALQWVHSRADVQALRNTTASTNLHIDS